MLVELQSPLAQHLLQHRIRQQTQFLGVHLQRHVAIPQVIRRLQQSQRLRRSDHHHWFWRRGHHHLWCALGIGEAASGDQLLTARQLKQHGAAILQIAATSADPPFSSAQRQARQGGGCITIQLLRQHHGSVALGQKHVLFGSALRRDGANPVITATNQTMTDTPNQLPPWRGSVSLDFELAADGTTQWQGGARSPLKLLRHFTAGDGRCVMPLLHTAGGLVGGDQLEIALHAAAGSRSFLTSVAAQKIYGSRGRSRVQPQGRWAQITLQAELEAGADLEWLPQETVVFAGALLEQQQQITLAPGASWLGADVVRLGRTARGEDLGAGRFCNSLSIRRGEQWSVVERLSLEQEQLPNPHGMGGEPVLGTLIWIAPEPLENEQLAQLLKGGRADREGLSGTMAIGPLEPGLIARYRGGSSQAARLWFFRLWRRIRAVQGLSEPSWPRTWPFQEAELALNPEPATTATTAAR